MARARMSTVYMPGDKITMLPDEVVKPSPWPKARPARRCRCTPRSTRPTGAWSTTVTRAELVPIKSNLRHNDLDELVNEETLASGEGEYPHKAELALLWQWALQLEAGA
jgi:exoribonuclease-2